MILCLDCVMPINGRFIELRTDTIKFRLHGIVLEISVFKVTAPEVFKNSSFCMMLVPSIVCLFQEETRSPLKDIVRKNIIFSKQK